MKPAEHEAQLVALRRVAFDVLTWAAAMEKMSGPGWSPGLWRTAGFLDPRHPATPIEPVALAPPGSVADPEGAFDQLLRQDAGEPVSHGSAAVYDVLVSRGEQQARGNHRGYGKVAAAVFRAAGTGGEA